ncbi:MAG: glycosyltransferase family 4 protein, partial [Clostridia bacterium]|nr:glycosyltransferase family 4 protein [Clostridia bacterium]
IAISPAAKDNLMEMGVPEGKITVFMNGVEPLKRISGEEIEKARDKYGIRPGEKVAGMVGRLETFKGHEYFIRAAKLCRDRGVKIKFMIVGNGWIENKLRQMARDEGVGDEVIFTGFMMDVTPVVNIFDVLVNASYGTEASSLAMLEAMSLGKPVVATDYGGNPFQVKDGETGIIIPKKDESALADALIDLMSDDDKYNRFASNTIEEYNKRFTAEVMCRNIESVYEKLTG